METGPSRGHSLRPVRGMVVVARPLSAMLVARRQVEVDGDRAFARLVAYGDLLGGAAGERQGQWLDREAVIGRGGEGDGDRQVAGIGQLDKASTARADEHRAEVDSLRCIGQPAPEAAAG